MLKFIIAILILFSAEFIMSSTQPGSLVADGAAIICFTSAIYVFYRIFSFGTGLTKNATPSVASTAAVPKHEKRPDINTNSADLTVVRRERIGFEKWKIVVGRFGPNGQIVELGSNNVTTSVSTFSHGKALFTVTWA